MNQINPPFPKKPAGLVFFKNVFLSRDASNDVMFVTVGRKLKFSSWCHFMIRSLVCQRPAWTLLASETSCSTCLSSYFCAQCTPTCLQLNRLLLAVSLCLHVHNRLPGLLSCINVICLQNITNRGFIFSLAFVLGFLILSLLSEMPVKWMAGDLNQTDAHGHCT